MANMIEIRGLNKYFGDLHVLKDIDLTVEEGEKVVIIGPSGSGKSTLIRCVDFLEEPTSGEVIIDGTPLTKKNHLEMARTYSSMVFQQFNLYPNMTVLGNLTLAPIKLQKKSKEEATQAAMAALKRVGLAHKAGEYPQNLSGGQQQRVALARMLAARPGILMFDEPFSALDSYLKSALEQNLLDVFSVVDRTALYVSHDIDEACRLCDRICVMHNGCVEESGTAGELIARPQTLAGMRLTGCKNTSRARKVSDTVVEALDWGMTFDMGREVPDDVAYLGVRARHIHRDRARATGELGRNSFDLHVARVSDARFERLVLLEPPLGGSRSRIQWKVDILDAPTGSLPEAGETLRLHFDASRLLLVNR